MCGLVGIWDTHINENKYIKKMLGSITHRGPDDFGFWEDIEKGIYLAHRRLKIIDISDKANQPMQSVCGRYTLLFNGEIYNYKEIKKLLPDYNFRSNSDTEVLLGALINFGIDKCLELINGMFAFAFFDTKKENLYLVRDRLGEKPLYFGKTNNGIIFSSELKALKEFPFWDKNLNNESIYLYFKYGYIPSPKTIYENIFKLEPAHFVLISKKGREISCPTKYWNIKNLLNSRKIEINRKFSLNDLIEDLNRKILESVNSRMISDVPIGAFLSSGVDSTTIAYHMQKISRSNIKTFSIGNSGPNNEAKLSSNIAKFLGTDHFELYVNDKNVITELMNISNIYDEPFSDVSQIPTLLVSSLARKEVKVALSGDGGDELFGGYKRHIFGSKLWNLRPYLPRTMINKILSERLINNRKNTFLEEIFSKLPDSKYKYFDYLEKIRILINSENRINFYDQIRSNFIDPKCFLNIDKKSSHINFDADNSFLEMMMYWDLNDYLSDGLMTKIDRASMSQSLEVRSPFLDHEFIQYIWKIPFEYKVKRNTGKWILREALYKNVPRNLIQNSKKGFEIPLGSLLRGPLKDWAESLLNDTNVNNDRFLNRNTVNKLWTDHILKKSDESKKLWTILMFRSWLINQ